MRPVLLAVALLVVGPAAAQSTASSPEISARSATPELLTPDQIMRRGVDRLVGFLVGSGEPTPQSILRFVESQIAPYFDFAYMARWVAGPSARHLDEAQRVRLTQKVRALFLTALANNLGSFQRPLPEVRVYSARMGSSAREARVPARVMTADGQLTRLDFRFYWTGYRWMIFDVAANGASAVAFYRRYFSEEFRQRGLEAALG